VLSRATPPPFINSADLLATDRVLLALSPDLMSRTQTIRSAGFVLLPGDSDLPHYLVVLTVPHARQICDILQKAKDRSPSESGVISRLLREWTRICERLDVPEEDAMSDPSGVHGHSGDDGEA